MSVRTSASSVVAVLVACGCFSQPTNEWVLADPSGNWFLPSNWSLESIPDASQHVIIDQPDVDSRANITSDAEARSVFVGAKDGPGDLSEEIRLAGGTLTTTGTNTIFGAIRSAGEPGELNALCGGTWLGDGEVIFGGDPDELRLKFLRWGLPVVNVQEGRLLRLIGVELVDGAVIQATIEGSSVRADRVSGQGSLIIGTELRTSGGTRVQIEDDVTVLAESGSTIGNITLFDSGVLSIVRGAGGSGEPVSIGDVVSTAGATVRIGRLQTLDVETDRKVDVRGTLEMASGAQFRIDAPFVFRETGTLVIPAVSEATPITASRFVEMRDTTVVRVNDPISGATRIAVLEAQSIVDVASQIEADLPAGFVAEWDVSATTADIVVRCLADTNGDGLASPADFNAWVIAFNTQSFACDQNDDGLCTPADFNAWILNFNAGC